MLSFCKTGVIIAPLPSVSFIVTVGVPTVCTLLRLLVSNELSASTSC